MRRPRGMLVAIALVAALFGGNAFVSDAQVSPDVIETGISRTVLLVLIDKEGNELGGCSGSFVSPVGLILTAAHCVRATSDKPKIGITRGQLFNPEGLLAVGVNLPDRVKPVIVLVARRIVDSPSLDVALLKVVALLGPEKPRPLPSNFRVPFMRLADSETVRIGEAIAVLGFPGNGDDTITVTQGHVTGFTADEENNKTWLKHDAATGHGASGGPIINEKGEQIAVTSWGKPDPQNRVISYRSVLTNRIPMPWARYFQGGTVGASPQPSPPSQPAPPPQPPRSGAVAVLRGRIVDASSGSGIAGAVIVILRPGTSPQSATRQDMLAGGQTDGNGAFQTGPPVPKGATYPVAVLAKGYRLVVGNLEISANDPDEVVMKPVQLQEE